MTYFEGFEETYVPVKSDLCKDVKIHTLISGSRETGGPCLVLLHGYPQTYFIYHKIANKLVDAGYTVIIPDLRGYGKSSKPKAGEKHLEYSKREMGSDIVQVA
jgi:haloacetate dehalogenase